MVTLPAEIDMANAAQVRAELDAAFGPNVSVVVADMTGTRFCDTSGIHALVMAHKKAQAGKTRFGVVAGPGEVRQVLGILRLDTVLAIYPQLGMALAATDCAPADGQQGPQAGGQPKTRPGGRGAGDADAVA